MNLKDVKENIKKNFPNDYKMVLKVLKFAKRKHKNQKRDDGTPYIEHPIRVAEFTLKYKVSKNASMLYMAALLHDAIEDTYVSYRELCERFSEEVASIVMELSTAKFAPLWLDGGKAEYLSKKMINMTKYALLIKLCDRLDNLNTLSGCKKEKQVRVINETKIIIENVTKNRKLTESQEKVVKAINKQVTKLDKELSN